MRVCYHDLARGVLLEELLGGDGPYNPVYGLDQDLRLDTDAETVYSDTQATEETD